MRQKLVAGNWKMNLDSKSSEELISSVTSRIQLDGNNVVVFAPPFPLLDLAVRLTSHQKGYYIGAQNCHHEKAGAFTGEVSAAMLKSIGVDYVILGHSERRLQFGESNALLLLKVNAAYSAGLKLIFCCGETLSERKSNIQETIIRAQLHESLFHLTEDQIRSVVIAYEPVWAIGTGLNATPDQAVEIHQFIRSLLADRYDAKTAEKCTILYGGSCNSKNAGELFARGDVDGGLVGGASIVSDDFVSIIKARFHS